jgi:tetratricopeptide (TPR) repeat protein
MRATRFIPFACLLLVLVSGAAADETEKAETWQKSYDAEAAGKYEDAVTQMVILGNQGEDTYEYYLRRGWTLYLAARSGEAIMWYEKARQAEPKAVEPHLGIMPPLMALRRWNEAITAGTEVLKIDPANYYGLSRMAYISYQQGQYREAEKFYRRVLQLYPSDVEMKSGLAWTLLKGGKRNDATKLFREILRIAPKHAATLEGVKELGR